MRTYTFLHRSNQLFLKVSCKRVLSMQWMDIDLDRFFVHNYFLFFLPHGQITRPA